MAEGPRRLDSFGVQHMGMEAAGMYWKPVPHARRLGAR